MRYILPTFLLLFCLATGCTTQPRFYLGGIQVNEPSTEKWITALRDHGYNTVAVTIYAHQGDWDSDTFWFDSTNAGVINEIREAKQRGLKVVLILRVALDHAYTRNAFLWHGMIMPKDDAMLRSWFAKYRAFVLTWSRIAEREGVDILGIGSELNTMTSTTPIDALPPLLEFYLDSEKQAERIASLSKLLATHTTQSSLEKHYGLDGRAPDELVAQESAAQRAWALSMCGGSTTNCLLAINTRRKKLLTFWKTLIAETRASFSGSLTYAANFDQFESVAFWKSLDFIGINAYFPLRPYFDSPVSLQTVSQGWNAVFASIASLRTAQQLNDMPVLFTELGYTFRENSTLEPWSSTGYSLVYREDGTPELLVWKDQAFNYQERVLALRALEQVSRQHPISLKGILYWKLSTQEAHREIEPFVHIVGSEDDREFEHILQKFREPPEEAISSSQRFLITLPLHD